MLENSIPEASKHKTRSHFWLWVSLVLTVVLWTVTAGLAKAYHQAYGKWCTLDAASQASLVVDLSTVGEWETDWHQAYGSHHGQVIELQTVPTMPVDELLAALKGLDGAVEIINSEGESVEAVAFAFELDRYVDRPAGAPRVVHRIGRLVQGDYTLRVGVLEPAPALSGVEQVLVADYAWCGLERMPASLTKVLAVAAGFLASCVTFWCVWAWWRWSRRSPDRQPCSGGRQSST